MILKKFKNQENCNWYVCEADSNRFQAILSSSTYWYMYFWELVRRALAAVPMDTALRLLYITHARPWMNLIPCFYVEVVGYGVTAPKIIKKYGSVILLCVGWGYSPAKLYHSWRDGKAPPYNGWHLLQQERKQNSVQSRLDMRGATGLGTLIPTYTVRFLNCNQLILRVPFYQ